MKTNTAVSLVLLCGSLAAGGAVLHNYSTSHPAPHVDLQSDMPRFRPLGRFHRRKHPMTVEDKRLFHSPPLYGSDARRTHSVASFKTAPSPHRPSTPEDLAAATVAGPPDNRRAPRRMRKRMMLEQEITETVDGKLQLGMVPAL